MESDKKSVLIVDDSRAMCQFLTEVLSKDPALQVVGHALDAFEAREMIKKLSPDVLTLDVEMPRMDGVTFLRNLMRLRPMPVVMLSSLTARGAEVTLDALGIGAVDFLVKRHPGSVEELRAYTDDIRRCVRGASVVRLNDGRTAASQRTHPDYSKWAGRLRGVPPASSSVHRVIALGASTGGPNAIAEVIKSLRLDNACMLLSQHMPSSFMVSFAQRLDTLGTVHVRIAQEGEVLQPRHVYVAPGDRHLAVKRVGGDLIAVISHAPPCNDHRPSVDTMFASVAEVVQGAAIGVLLTGMGRDGADGLKAMQEQGAVTIAQDELSSAVWGMPGSAVRLNAADAVLGLSAIAQVCEKLIEVGANVATPRLALAAARDANPMRPGT